MILILMLMISSIEARKLVCHPTKTNLEIQSEINFTTSFPLGDLTAYLVDDDQYIPNDYDIHEDETVTEFGWGLDRINQHYLPLDANINHNNTQEGSGVVVYIIDSGMWIQHKEFNHVRNGVDYVDGTFTQCHDHGTHVGGIVGSKTFGVASQVLLINIRVLGCDGSGSSFDLIQGIVWAIQDCNGRRCIINLSLGGGKSKLLNQAIKDAYNAGMISVCSAGNDNKDACGVSPANEPKCITVGSTQSNDKRSGFSNWGKCVNIFAPGSRILAPIFNNKLGYKSGTSMAAPHVSGVLALLWKRNLTRDQVVDLLFSSATKNVLTDTKNTANLLVYIPNSSFLISKSFLIKPSIIIVILSFLII